MKTGTRLLLLGGGFGVSTWVRDFRKIDKAAYVCLLVIWSYIVIQYIQSWKPPNKLKWLYHLSFIYLSSIYYLSVYLSSIYHCISPTYQSISQCICQSFIYRNHLNFLADMRRAELHRHKYEKCHAKTTSWAKSGICIIY